MTFPPGSRPPLAARLERREPPARLIGEFAVLELLQVQLDVLGLLRVLDVVPEFHVGLAARGIVRGRGAGQGDRRLAGLLWRLAFEQALERVGELARALVALLGILG